jgi:hypothetical protein
LQLKFIVIDSNDNEFYGKERSPATELHHYMLSTEMCFNSFGNQFIIKYNLGKVTLCIYCVPQFYCMHGILFDYLITNGMCVSIYPFLPRFKNKLPQNLDKPSWLVLFCF